MKNFVKALNRNGPEFSFLCEEFPRLSTEKIKMVVFKGPEIRQLFRDAQFDLVLSDDEKVAGNVFRHVATGCLGNVKAVNFRKSMKDLITTHEKQLQNITQDAFLPFTLAFFSG
jgi:hypothetical protein